MENIKLELSLFNWHKDSRTLTAEISDLPIKSLPLYLTISNPKTKQERVFRYNKTDKKDNEIQAWRYENISHNIKLTIWND